MNEIKCPHCNKVFTVDESGYAALLNQVRDHAFKEELEKRSNAIDEKNKIEIDLARTKVKEEQEKIINTLNLKIQELTNKINNSENEKALAIQQNNLSKNEEMNKLNLQINELNTKLKANEIENKLNIQKALSEKDFKIQELNNTIKQNESEYALKVQNEKEKYLNDLKRKDEEIAFYKDLKAKMSTKLVGETLEQHCLIQFNQLRMTAFKDAYFEKDNDIKTGSKGDFIYRENTSEGVELISIMFEMKNENEETLKKHKNEDFFKELDKDRNEKGCEYAVLVSMLEPESELYNAGIVDVSYRYPKMYVIRPQCFIPMITLLRNAALNAVNYKNELAIAKNQNVDITNFEDSLLEFQDKFSKDMIAAKDKFDKAIEEIDKTILHLTKVRENLVGSTKKLELANNKAQGLSIKKLTRNNPTMKEMFNSLKDKND